MTPSPSSIEWLAGAVENLDVEKDRVYTVWYHEDPTTGAWAADPSVTGEAQEEEIAVTAEGENFIRRSYLAATNPPTCMPEGNWRAEIYVNGRFAGGGKSATQFPDLEAAQARDLAMATCIPPDWELSENQAPGLVRGWTNKEGTEGAYLWVINEGILDTGNQSENRAKEVLDAVLPAFEFTLPSPPRQGETNASPFMGLAGETVKTYQLEKGGGMLAGIGFTEDGETVVGYAFGDFDDNEDFYVGEAVDRVFESFSQY